MKAFINIGREATEDKRGIYFDEQLSHHIRESELERALADARYNFWKTDVDKGSELGKRLYGYLNGSGGQVAQLLEESRQKGERLSLFLDIPYELNALPFELLLDDKGFLAQRAHPRTFIIRTVAHHKSRQELIAEKRPLKVLFMACSPLDLPAKDVLSFEREEELILASVEQFAVDLIIEDSGSVRGLFEALFEQGPFDVVHITGHAGHEAGKGPVFYMEDDTGGLVKVSPQRLWDEALKHHPPELLFLSGCSTGKADKVSGAESFSHQMVEKGVSRVLGWGLPVSDTGATRLTTDLYRYLGMGQSVVKAVDNARKALQEAYHPWPLLRLFTDGSPLSALIAEGQLRRWQVRKTTYKTLSDSHVRVLESGFVGRRRQIQQGARVLKGVLDEHGVRRFGVLIRGPAGIGKSCLAAKLIERFKDLKLVVVHGRLTRPDIVNQLRRLFDRKGVSAGLEVLKSDLEYEDKIKELFRTVFRKLPVMIYLDDFEQNLVSRGDYWQLEAEVIPVLRPILQALDWYEDSNTRLIITSRYRFELQYEGETLSDKLADITLLAFRDADLEKKTAELPNIAKSEYRSLYLKIGGGNPRLLEWLEKIAKDESKYDLRSLQQKLEGQSEKYIQDYLADILAGTEDEAFGEFMQQAAVYRRPVEASAYAALGDAAQLEKGVDLTLFERERASGQEPVYWVMPVIRDQQWGKLSAGAQKALHKKALDWYEDKIAASKQSDYELLREAVYHALACDQIRAGCRYAIGLGEYLKNLFLYNDILAPLQAVAERITDQVVAEAQQEKDEAVGTLFNNLGSTHHDLGDAKTAIGFYQQALDISLKVFGNVHSHVAITYNNLGEAYLAMGDAKTAIGFYQQALEIDLNALGDQHPIEAILYSNIGKAYMALGDTKKAIGYFEQALEIDLNAFGDKHPHVAVRYNNLGDAYNALDEAKKAIRYFEKALKIGLNAFGDKHPDVAIYYNNLGMAYRALGDTKTAIGYYEQALAIDLNVYGDKHPDVATCYNNLGLAYHDLDDLQTAIGYYEQALAIDLNVYGEQHPNVAISLNNLGGVHGDLGNAKTAIGYYEQALAIFRANYGDDHPQTQNVSENIKSLAEK